MVLKKQSKTRQAPIFTCVDASTTIKNSKYVQRLALRIVEDAAWAICTVNDQQIGDSNLVIG